jgi:hypothetical protein
MFWLATLVMCHVDHPRANPPVMRGTVVQMYNYMERDKDGTVWYFGFVPRVTRTQNAPRQPKYKQPVQSDVATFTVLETIQNSYRMLPWFKLFNPIAPPEVESRNSYFGFECFASTSPGL